MQEIVHVGLDFDKTLDRLPRAFSAFINIAREDGHKVFLVTARRDTDEHRATIAEWLEANGIEVTLTLFTSLGSKIAYMKSRGIRIDIWIDDDPETLVRGH